MIEIADDTPIRDYLTTEAAFAAFNTEGIGPRLVAEKLARLVEATINLDEQVLGVDEEGHAILGIEREDLIGAILGEMKSAS